MSRYNATVVAIDAGGERMPVAQFTNPYAADAYRDWIAQQDPDLVWVVEDRVGHSKPLDPKPWTWLDRDHPYGPTVTRHARRGSDSDQFDPRPGYSQNREDYE